MEDCQVTETVLSRNTKGEWITSAYVSCMSVDGVEED
jgi:hypothetical protein